MGIKAALQPAIEVNRALGEVKSLGVAEQGLRKLQQASLDFTMSYGGAAAEFIRSSYDIQSAIAGLTDNELSQFTAASATLAKGTKSSSQTITAYMGTMYGIFQKQADAMGKGAWVEQIAGQTATAVQMFKTTGDQMSGAFTSLGASANAAGIDAAEQFAILGQLQATMSGSEAGTKYKSFLGGIGNAEKVLGLSFTNQDGSMKGVVEIMNLIQGKFGDLSKVADSDLLKKAFGSDEAVAMIKLLNTNITGLESNITALGNVKGMDKATEMALSMVDPWEQGLAVINAIRIEIGTQLLPVLYPFLNKANEGGKAFAKWLRMYPNITRAIGLLAAALLSMAAAGALANILCGVSTFLWGGLKLIYLACAAPIKLLIVLYGQKTYVMKAFNFVAKITRAVYLAMSIAIGSMNIRAKAELVLMRLRQAGMVLYCATLKATNIVMRIYAAGTAVAAAATQLLLSPIGLVIAGVLALGVGIYLLIKHWDAVTAAVKNTEAFQYLQQVTSNIALWFDQVWAGIVRGWDSVVNYFSTKSPAQVFSEYGTLISSMFDGVWTSIQSAFLNVLNWMIEKLNKIPGVSIDMKAIPAPEAMNNTPTATGGPLLTGGQLHSAGSGGIAQQIRSNSENKTRIDQSQRTVNVTVERATPADLNEWMELHAY
ncbi:MAG: phage tail tape measure protein [Plesiomonas shigelloides]